MLHFGDPDWYDQYVGPLRANYTQADKVQVGFIGFFSLVWRMKSLLDRVCNRLRRTGLGSK